MNLPEASAEAMRTGLDEPLRELLEAWRLADSPPGRHNETPALIVDAFEQLFDVMQRTEASQTAGGSAPGVQPDAVTELGEYALGLFEQTLNWANHLDLDGVSSDLQTYTIAMANWIAARGGRLTTLEPVVDAFAGHANATRDAGELMALYRSMSAVLRATAAVIRQDADRSNPGRPWRILHLNRAIVATRTQQPDLMDEAFNELIRQLPEDAAGFFSQGMEQMELLNYPPQVRAVMDRYYRKWSVNRSLH